MTKWQSSRLTCWPEQQLKTCKTKCQVNKISRPVIKIHLLIVYRKCCCTASASGTRYLIAAKTILKSWNTAHSGILATKWNRNKERAKRCTRRSYQSVSGGVADVLKWFLHRVYIMKLTTLEDTAQKTQNWFIGLICWPMHSHMWEKVEGEKDGVQGQV